MALRVATNSSGHALVPTLFAREASVAAYLLFNHPWDHRGLFWRVVGSSTTHGHQLPPRPNPWDGRVKGWPWATLGFFVPGGRAAWTEANPHFARAVGASRTGQIDVAEKEVLQLASLRDTLTQVNDSYWADQVDIQRQTATAWITLAKGNPENALTQMRFAAEHEDRTDKTNVTPGVILPARELLGEMLLGLKQPAQAMIEFEATLRTAPNRFNALSGAARAAKLSGDKEKAKTYYTKLLAICQHADGDRPELQDARSLLAQK